MKTVQTIYCMLATALLVGCGDSHNPNKESAGGGASPSSTSEMEKHQDNVSYGTNSDTSRIDGRTPAGSLTSEAPPSGSTRSSGNLTPDDKEKSNN